MRKELLNNRGFDEDTCPPIIMYAKDGHFALQGLASIGFQVIGLDWTQDPAKSREIVGSAITLQVNIIPWWFTLYFIDLSRRAKVFLFLG